MTEAVIIEKPVHWFAEQINARVKQPRLSESIISEMLKLWGSFLFRKCSKFNVDSKNAIKIQQKDQIIASEVFAANSPYFHENNCHS